MRRVNIIGNSGSGKTTLGRELSHRLGCPFHELDDLHWRPGWTQRDPVELRQEVASLTQEPAWVFDGNYADLVRDLVWERVDTVIWLDYSLPRCLWRLTRRTLGRRGQRLWHAGNQESLRSAFFSADSLFLFALRSHGHRRQQNLHQLYREGVDFQSLRFVTPQETQAWLDGLTL